MEKKKRSGLGAAQLCIKHPIQGSRVLPFDFSLLIFRHDLRIQAFIPKAL
jgi:hypothetical protein